MAYVAADWFSENQCQIKNSFVSGVCGINLHNDFEVRVLRISLQLNQFLIKILQEKCTSFFIQILLKNKK